MNVKPATKRYGFLLLAAALPTLNLGMAQTKNPEVKPEAKCQIEGTVVNAMTGEPLKKAHLSLRPYAQRSTPYGAITDKTGHFLLDDVDPGQYVLIAWRNGFLGQGYSPPGGIKHQIPNLELAPGQKMKEVVFKLFPQGVITGHVIDEDGEPLANAAVQCMRVGYQRGKRQLLPAGGARANDLGEYRVRELAAGRYYVSASYRAQDMFISTTSEWLMGGAAEDAYGPTYYPNTTEANSAAPIEITPGTQVEGIDLRLVRIRTVHIRGRIVNLPSGRSGDAHVQLLPRDTGAGHGSPSRVPVVGREGTFEVRGVTQGSYFLLAGYSDADVQLIARVPIEIETSNVDNVELALAPGGEISGRLVIEGNANSNTNDATTPTGATNRPHAPGKLHGLHGGRRPVRGVYWACQMDVHAVLTALYAERKRVERAIARLEARRRATLPTQSRFGSSRRIDRFL